MEPKDLGKKSFTPGDPLNPMNGFDPGASEPDFDPAPPAPDPKPPVTPPVTPKQGEPAPKQGDQPQYTDRERRLYERAKKAEEKLKKHNLSPDDEPQAPAPKADPAQASADPFSLAKTIASLKDYDAEEIDFASTIASAKRISPQEAVKTREFQLWIKGKRDDDIKNNRVPAPNSSTPASTLPNSSDIAKMSKADHARLEREYLAKQRNKGSGF